MFPNPWIHCAGVAFILLAHTSGGVYSNEVLDHIDRTEQQEELHGGDHDASKFSIITRRIEAKRPVDQFMFEAQINDEASKIIGAKVAFDSRLNKLRVDFSSASQRHNTLQLIDLNKNIVFHKLPLPGDSSKSARGTCGASLMEPKRLISIGRILLGADLVEDLGGATEGDHIRKYRAVQSSLPLWLNQDLEPPSKDDAITEINTSFFHFDTIDGAIDRLVGIEVETVKIANGRPVLSKKLKISIANFDWTLNDAPEDVSTLFSLARECPSGDENVHRVSVESVGRNQVDIPDDGTKRNLLILHTIQTSLKLPSELISSLSSKVVRDKNEIKLVFDFSVTPWTRWMGSFRRLLEGDSRIKSKNSHTTAISGSSSFSQCYYYASTQDGLDPSGHIDQTFFSYETGNNVCHLASDANSIAFTGARSVFTMRKVPPQIGVKLDRWLKAGVEPWLALNGLKGTAVFKMTKLNLDGVDVKLRVPTAKPHIIPDHHNNTKPDDGPSIEPSYSVGTVLTLALFSIGFVLVALTISHLRHRISVRKASAMSDLEEIVVHYSAHYSREGIEIERSKEVLEMEQSKHVLEIV